MVTLDEVVLTDPARLEAVKRVGRTLPALSIPLDAIASLAARLLKAPMAAVTLVDREEVVFAARYGLPDGLSRRRRMPLSYSLCRYVVSADDVAGNTDLRRESDPALRHHRLVTEYDVQSFLGAPMHDEQHHPVGSLIVFDTVPRNWTGPDASTLLELTRVLRVKGEPAAARTAVASLSSVSLLESSQEAFLAVNPDGVVVDCNGAAESLLGFTRKQLCDHRLDDKVLDDHGQPPFAAELRRLLAVAPLRPVRRQIVLKHRDGHRLPVRALISVVGGADGALACVFIADLTEQRAAEERADRNAGFLAALLDSLSVGVLACDSAGEIVLLNRALREAQGLPGTGEIPADYPALTTGVLCDSDLRPLPWDRMPLMRAQSGEHVRTDIVAVVPGVRVRTFAVTAQPITAGDGVPMGAVAVSDEVTALRRVEQFRACHVNVERALTRAASMTEAAPAVLRTVVSALGWTAAELFLMDTSTGVLRPIGHWGVPGFDPDQFFDHSPVKGASVTGRVWETGRQVWVQDIAVTKNIKTPFEKSRADICVRNGIRTILAVPVRDGTLLGVLTCYATTTEPHEDLLTVLLDGVAAQIGTFVALRHADQLTLQLERIQDDFISLVGHELRTPLTSISAYASLLADGGGHLDDDSRHMLSGISRNSHELVEIVSRLLELAGLEAGHLPLDIQRVDLGAIITDAVTAVRADLAARRIRLQVDARTLEVEADAHRLRQAIDDLISNAVKYSPDGGEICVRAGHNHGTTRIQIIDSGIGVAAEDRSRLFDRFYRGGNVRHHGTPGSGLGLSRVRTIVKLHGGTIALVDNEPAGTIAIITLPTVQPKTAAASKNPSPSTGNPLGNPL